MTRAREDEAAAGTRRQSYDGIVVSAHRHGHDTRRLRPRVQERDVSGGSACGDKVDLGQGGDGKQGMRGGPRIDAGLGGQVPGLETVVPGGGVGDCGVVGFEDDVGDGGGVAGHESQGATLRGRLAGCVGR